LRVEGKGIEAGLSDPDVRSVNWTKGSARTGVGCCLIAVVWDETTAYVEVSRTATRLLPRELGRFIEGSFSKGSWAGSVVGKCPPREDVGELK